MYWHLLGYCVLGIMLVASLALAALAVIVAINAQNRLKRIALAMTGDDPAAADELNIETPDNIVDAAVHAIRFHKVTADRVADMEREAADRALAAIRMIDPAQLAPHLFNTHRQSSDDGWNDVAAEALDVVESTIRSYCAAPPETAGDASPAEVSP